MGPACFLGNGIFFFFYSLGRHRGPTPSVLHNNNNNNIIYNVYHGSARTAVSSWSRTHCTKCSALCTGSLSPVNHAVICAPADYYIAHTRGGKHGMFVGGAVHCAPVCLYRVPSCDRRTHAFLFTCFRLYSVFPSPPTFPRCTLPVLSLLRKSADARFRCLCNFFTFFTRRSNRIVYRRKGRLNPNHCRNI